MNIKRLFFSLQLLFGTILNLIRTGRDVIKNVYRASCTLPAILVKLKETSIFHNRFFGKHSHIKFHETFSGGSRVAPCGRTDRRVEANSRFSQFCESA